MKECLIGILILFFLAISARLTYAEICSNHNGEITLDGTPHPELHNCTLIVAPETGHSETVIHVNNDSKPETVVKTEVITVVVTATPLPTPTTKPYIPYKTLNIVRFTPTPTLVPTASPSAANIPIPTKHHPHPPARQKPNVFQIIVRFFQNIFNN
jgi:hypothetical protein